MWGREPAQDSETIVYKDIYRYVKNKCRLLWSHECEGANMNIRISRSHVSNLLRLPTPIFLLPLVL
jgi:hypothetical protein